MIPVSGSFANDAELQVKFQRINVGCPNPSDMTYTVVNDAITVTATTGLDEVYKICYTFGNEWTNVPDSTVVFKSIKAGVVAVALPGTETRYRLNAFEQSLSAGDAFKWVSRSCSDVVSYSGSVDGADHVVMLDTYEEELMLCYLFEGADAYVLYNDVKLSVVSIASRSPSKVVVSDRKSVV